jgi:hypothetical protein
MEENINLGGNIVLSGFKDLEPGVMFIIKKVVGNYVKKMSEKSAVENLTLTLKKVHESADGQKTKFEIMGKLIAGKMHNSECTDFNLFVAIDKVLAKMMNEM